MDNTEKLKQLISERIKEERKVLGLNQKDLSIKVGKSLSAISGYETGEILPPIDIVNRFADIFDCSADYLLGRSPHRDYRIESLPLEDGKTMYFGVLKSAEKLTREEKIKIAAKLLNDANQDD